MFALGCMLHYAALNCEFIEWDDRGFSMTVKKELKDYVEKELGPNVNIDMKVGIIITLIKKVASNYVNVYPYFNRINKISNFDSILVLKCQNLATEYLAGSTVHSIKFAKYIRFCM